MCPTVALIILVAVFPAFMSAEESGTCNVTSTANVDWNKNLTSCFSGVVGLSKDPTCTKGAELGAKVEEFFKNHTSCTKYLEPPTRNESIVNATFIKLVEKCDMKLIEGLVNDKKCIKSKSEELNNCLTDQNGESIDIKDVKNVTMWPKRFILTYSNATCVSAKLLQNCTINALEKCKGAVEFVNRMFNVSFKSCPNGSSTLVTSFVMLLPTIVMYMLSRK